MTMPAAVSDNWARYRGLARNASWSGRARASVETPTTVASPSPCTDRPKREASCAAVCGARKGFTAAMPGAASEGAAEGELQALDFVARFLAERKRVADGNRTHLRAPQHRDACGRTQFAGAERAGGGEDVAEVHERRDSGGRTLDQGREVHLERSGGLHRAAERLQEGARRRDALARPQRVVAEATHRARAAGVEVLEERQAIGS